MSEKMKAVLKYRFENAQKWANYTGRLTPEVIEEMKLIPRLHAVNFFN